jgi:hypothetical protein
MSTGLRARTPGNNATLPNNNSSSTSASPSLPLIRFRPIAIILRNELDFLYMAQKIRRVLPHPVRWMADRLISSYPFYDVTIGLWMAIPYFLWAYGWILFWLLSINVFGSFMLHWALDAPSPGDVDARLRPRGRLSPSGFPCIEIQVAACLLAYIAWFHMTPLAIGLCTGVGGSIVLLRFYALTHFPHQIIVSGLLGAFSVPAGRAVARYFFKTRIHPHTHALGAIAVGSMIIGYIAYYAESNELPFMRIPRAECENKQMKRRERPRF